MIFFQFVSFDGLIWVVDDFFGEFVDGFWMVEMDGVISICEIYCFSGGCVCVENGKVFFECSVFDMKVFGKVVSKMELLNVQFNIICNIFSFFWFCVIREVLQF